MFACSWSRGDCPSEDEWCHDHVVSGVSDDQIESCVAGDGIDYLLEYCKDCSRRSVVRSHCSSLSRFAAECVAECHAGAEQEEDVYFQVWPELGHGWRSLLNHYCKSLPARDVVMFLADCRRRVHGDLRRGRHHL